jgi:hypothetical protein
MRYCFHPVEFQRDKPAMNRMSARFERYIGIDYSGAETCESSLKGLRVYMAERGNEPYEIPPPPSPRRYWTRKATARWLVERIYELPLTLVGIDHGFSFPLRYFEKYGLPCDWSAFLDDFQRHWPTDEDNTYVDFVRDGIRGNGARPAVVILAGGGLQKCEQVRNPFFISTCPDQWPNPPMPVFRGCALCV